MLCVCVGGGGWRVEEELLAEIRRRRETGHANERFS